MRILGKTGRHDSSDGDARWERFTRLLEPVHSSFLITARRLSRSRTEGDDLFQEAILRAYDRLPGLRDEGSFRSWLYTILLSVHRNRTRRGFWRRFISLEGEMDRGFDPPGAAGPDEEQRRRAERVSRALASLPAVQREAVVLFECEEFSCEEIAALQQVSTSAVKSRLQRGRERLRRSYERMEHGRTAHAAPGHAGPALGSRAPADSPGGAS
jgi:RNA polymerase sigma-70 factor (ECF subfamily)